MINTAVNAGPPPFQAVIALLRSCGLCVVFRGSAKMAWDGRPASQWAHCVVVPVGMPESTWLDKAELRFVRLFPGASFEISKLAVDMSTRLRLIKFRHHVMKKKQERNNALSQHIPSSPNPAST